MKLSFFATLAIVLCVVFAAVLASPGKGDKAKHDDKAPKPHAAAAPPAKERPRRPSVDESEHKVDVPAVVPPPPPRRLQRGEAALNLNKVQLPLRSTEEVEHVEPPPKVPAVHRGGGVLDLHSAGEEHDKAVAVLKEISENF
ncbi:hypothetical protein DFJ73DRAFT_940421 [Zopfochytrium polystomum]|nr:hypothetical protein DFJ73DRAFT_940421 [Zopfochytrium polystomum]